MNPSGYPSNGSRARSHEAGSGHAADGVADGERRGESSAHTELSAAASASLGEAWVRDVANELKAQDRGLVGAWPGTMREARSRVLCGMPAKRRSRFDPEALDTLSRAVYDAARRCWDQLAEPDLEP